MLVLLLLQIAAPPADGRIERVTVFADRAEVTRARTVECRPDLREVDFAAIPSASDPRTLRAEAAGKAKAIGTASRIVPLDEALDTKRTMLTAELEKIRARIAELEDAAGQGESRASLAKSYGGYYSKIWSEELRNPKPDPEAWKRALDAVKKEELESEEKVAGILAELRKVRDKEARIARKLSMLAPTAKLEARQVTVPIDCGGETGPVTVRLAYVVPGATWHPEYDVRFAGDKAEIVIASVVQQSTGEDWRDADIALSTAKPKLGTEAPYPAPLFVDAGEVERGKVLVQATERRDQLIGEGKDTERARPASAALDDGGHVFVLSIPHKATVLSDGRPYWMPIDQRTAQAKEKRVAVPKIRPYVYQMITYANPAPYPLLAGRVHVYRRGSYVGDTHQRIIGPGEPAELSLGVDEEVRVERKDVTEVDKGPGFLSSTKTMERAYRVKLKNRAALKVAVEVRESIPVSKIDDVKVELVEAKTSRDYKLDRIRGFVVWTVELLRGEEKALDIAYTVKLPSSWKVQ